MKKSKVTRLIGLPILSISLLGSTIVFASCASGNANNNNDVNRPPGDVNIPNPPTDNDNNGSQKPPVDNDVLPPPVINGPYASNLYGFATPNPNYPHKDPDNSFLVAHGVGPGGDYAPGEGVERKAEIHRGSLLNQTQVLNAKKSYSVAFESKVSFAGGTAWILDYKIPDNVTSDGNYNDSNYPLTWYFGTNAHVIDDLILTTDTLYPSNFDGHSYNGTYNIELTTPSNPAIGKVYKPTIQSEVDWERHDLYIYDEHNYQKHQSAKRIYIGNDFLTTSPKDFNKSERFMTPGAEEYADFGVFEYTFKTPQEAKRVTHDYANWKPEEKFRYKKKDLMNHPAEVKKDDFHIVGFPATSSGSKQYQELFVNRPKDPKGELANIGSSLSTSRYYNTAPTTHPGILDNSVGMSNWFGYQYTDAAGTKDFWYSSWGLIYPTNYGSMMPGSSGSLLTDGQGYSWGVHFGSDPTAVVSLAQAFYSGGYDYKGKYGKYNLPAYDLIAGEPGSSQYPLQKSSYRSNLVKLYGNQTTTYRTNLFPNGIKAYS